MTIAEIRTAIEARKARSAWDKGVDLYAFDLLEELEQAISYGYFDAADLEAPKLLKRQLLNGADNWHHYSWSGCSLIYNQDIAERLCTPSELKKTRNGQRRPNAQEEWLDVQGRALNQACYLILKATR
jgi:hypothetical protein